MIRNAALLFAYSVDYAVFLQAMRDHQFGAAIVFAGVGILMGCAILRLMNEATTTKGQRT